MARRRTSSKFAVDLLAIRLLAHVAFDAHGHAPRLQGGGLHGLLADHRALGVEQDHAGREDVAGGVGEAGRPAVRVEVGDHGIGGAQVDAHGRSGRRGRLGRCGLGLGRRRGGCLGRGRLGRARRLGQGRRSRSGLGRVRQWRHRGGRRLVVLEGGADPRRGVALESDLPRGDVEDLGPQSQEDFIPVEALTAHQPQGYRQLLPGGVDDRFAKARLIDQEAGRLADGFPEGGQDNRLTPPGEHIPKFTCHGSIPCLLDHAGPGAAGVLPREPLVPILPRQSVEAKRSATGFPGAISGRTADWR